MTRRFPEAMRRWTVLLVSHDSEAPQTYSVSEQTIRVAMLLGVAVGLVALVGVGTLIAGLGTLSPQQPARVAGLQPLTDDEASPGLRVLRNRYARLQGALDTIRQQESQLRATAGMPSTDTETTIQRFLSRLPAFLRSPRALASAPFGGAKGSVTAAGSVHGVDWTDTAQARLAVGSTGATADSLTEHALTVASELRKLADGTRIRRDTIEVFSLRPESLAAAVTRGARVVRQGEAVLWSPSRTSAVAAGVDAAVTKLVQLDGDRWEMELRAVGGTVARILAEGRPLVRLGEKVAQDQLVIVVEPAGDPAVAPVSVWLTGQKREKHGK